jgi:hypothetical protein
MRFARIALTVVAPALLLSAVPAGAADTPVHDRLNLMGADTNYLYWSVDPTDPELSTSSIIRYCGVRDWFWGIPGQSKPCYRSLGLDGAYDYRLFFFPASTLDESITWNAAGPLRFHLEGSIETGGAPFDVRLVLQKGTDLVESAPATQVSPGVWEGQLTNGGPLKSDVVNLLQLRVTTVSPSAVIDLRTAGRSYVQLPRPFKSRGVPEMMRADTYRPEPTSYSSASHTFTFNDANWKATTFTGETGPPEEFQLTLDENVSTLMAWIELYDTPFVHDVHRGRTPDRRSLQQGASVHLIRNGETLEYSGYGSGVGGWGVEAAAVPNVPAGPVTVRVQSISEAPDDRMPYKLHVLEVGGPRTIRTMRTRFLQQDAYRIPVAAGCPPSPAVVPATEAVESIDLDLDWDSEAVGIGGWTPRFSLPTVGEFPCSEAGTGDRVRLTVPGSRIWHVAATPAYDAAFFSAFDTRFELTARYVYSAPPTA